MIDIQKYGKFESAKQSSKKTQLILVHTSRNLEDYLSSITYRNNGKYKKIPHFLISKEGKILNFLKTKECSVYFTDDNINKNSIVISLENLGWLNKEPLKDYYVNWIGDIYNGKVIDKKWRDYFFWEPYSETQIKSTVFLCKKLLKEMGIKKEIIGHNTKINGIENFEGVVTRSNYDINFTDVSPAFDFDSFSKLMENE